MKDICCIGHITRDRIITPGNDTQLYGGTAYYFTHAISRLDGVKYQLITSLAHDDMSVVEEMIRKKVDVKVIESKNTVYFENKYGTNMDNRQQRVLSKADPFRIEDFADVEARFIHLGSLLADDFSPELVKSLSGKGVISVDAQGFLRYVDGENVKPCDWKEKIELFPYIDILKVNEHEILSLTNYNDPRQAARQLAEWGIKEVLLTFGSKGSLIYAEGKYYEIPAYKPSVLVDATGCGDTYAAGYIYMRAQGENYRSCGKFAAAVATLKLERIGAFRGTRIDAEHIAGYAL